MSNHLRGKHVDSINDLTGDKIITVVTLNGGYHEGTNVFRSSDPGATLKELFSKEIDKCDSLTIAEKSDIKETIAETGGYDRQWDLNIYLNDHCGQIIDDKYTIVFDVVEIKDV